MKKAFGKFLFYIVCVAVVVFLLNLFFGDSVAARVANWTWVKKYTRIQPHAPLVIHTREEVRVNDTNDIVAALSKSRGRVAGVIFTQDSRLVGAAVAVTSDGWFLSSKTAVGAYKPEQLGVVLSDGTVLPVQSMVLDPASRMVALRTKADGLSVVSFATSSELTAGQRVLLLAALGDGGSYFLTSYLSTGVRAASGVVLSDIASREILLQSVAGLIPGQAAFDMSGQLLGVWEGQYLIPASVAEEAVSSLLARQGSIARPVFGFYYRLLTPAQAAKLGTVTGMQLARPQESLSAVLANSAAARAGLREGDIITRVNGEQVSGSVLPDALLLGLPTNTKAEFEVYRGATTLQIEIVPANR